MFAFNVAVCALVAAATLSARRTAAPGPAQGAGCAAWTGMTLFAATLSAAVAAMGAHRAGWRWTWAATVAAGAALAWRELRVAAPFIDVRALASGRGARA